MSVLDLLASWIDKDLKNKWHILVKLPVNTKGQQQEQHKMDQ